jgi:hypothetical protein
MGKSLQISVLKIREFSPINWAIFHPTAYTFRGPPKVFKPCEETEEGDKEVVEHKPERP